MQKRMSMFMSGVIVLAGSVALAQTAGQRGDEAAKPAKPSDVVTVKGCLTKGPTNTFALTPTDAGDPLSTAVEDKVRKTPATYTYQLTGGQNLEAHVGQIVTATGTLDRKADSKTNIKDTEPAQPAAGPPSNATPPGKTPTVKTEEKAKVEVRHLIVQSVSSTGRSCTSGRSS